MLSYRHFQYLKINGLKHGMEELRIISATGRIYQISKLKLKLKFYICAIVCLNNSDGQITINLVPYHTF